MNKELEFINAKGDNFKIGYFDPFFLTGFDGNGTPSVTIYTSKNQRDGELYRNSTANVRNVVIDFDIVSDFMASKEELYQKIRLKEKCRLVYRQGDTARQIECYVESLNIDESMSDRKPVQLSLLCPSPYWFTLDEIRPEIASWLSLFEFPFELSDSFEFDTRSQNVIMNVFNNGHIECGMKVIFRARGSVFMPKIHSITQNKFIELEYIMQNGDEITIDTDKMVATIKRNQEVSDITNQVTYESDYFNLLVGDNLLKYSAEQNIDNLDITINFSPLYLGV